MTLVRPNHAHNHFEEEYGTNYFLTFAIKDEVNHGRAAGQMLTHIMNRLTDGCVDALVGDLTDGVKTLCETFKLEQTHNGIKFTFKAFFDMKTSLPLRYVKDQLQGLLDDAFSRALIAKDSHLVVPTTA